MSLYLPALAIFGATFVALIARQVTGRGPRPWVLLGVGGLAMLAVGALSPAGAVGVLVAESPVFLVLVAIFVFVAALDVSGSLEHLARWIVGRAGTAENLPLALFVGIGLLSAVMINDALVLVAVPVILSVARRQGIDPVPLLLVMAYAVTVGSVLTPIGNPQNLLVAIGSGMGRPLTTFLRYLLVPTLASLAAGGLYLRWAMRPSVTPSAGMAEETPRVRFFPRGGWGARLRRAPAIAIFPATLAALLATELVPGGSAGSPLLLPELALIGAAVVLLVSPARIEIVRRVDYRILLLFAGLFVVVAGAVAGGLLGWLSSALPVAGPAAPRYESIGSLTLASLLGPQLVSNVPFAALEISVVHHLGYGAGASAIWLTLAGASTLAGNLTLIGAASNLIVVEQAEARGYRIRLGSFVRYGLPLTLLSAGLLFVCLLAGI